MDKLRSIKRSSLRVYNRLARKEQPKNDIVFNTHIKTESKTITWTIQNANKCPLDTGEYLETPIFRTGFTNQTEWCLRLYPKGRNALNSEKVGLFLYKVTSSTKIGLEVKLLEKKYYSLLDHIFDETWKVCTESEEIGLDNLIDCENLSDILEIVCQMQVSYMDEDEDPASQISESFSANCNCTLSSDFKELYTSGKFTDAVLQVGKKQFNVHKTILAARSAVFSAMFEHDMKESKTNTVAIEDVEPSIIDNILQHIYTGKIDNMNVDKAIFLYPVSDKYSLLQLKKECSSIILQNLSEENVCRVAVLADLHCDCKLKDATDYYFRNYSSQIFEKGAWKALVQDKPLLASEIVKSVVSDYKTKCLPKCPGENSSKQQRPA